MLKYHISVSVPPDRNYMVAEIFFDTVQWAEINQERGQLSVEFYNRPDNGPWKIPFGLVVESLNAAKEKLQQLSIRS